MTCIAHKTHNEAHFVKSELRYELRYELLLAKPTGVGQEIRVWPVRRFMRYTCHLSVISPFNAQFSDSLCAGATIYA